MTGLRHAGMMLLSRLLCGVLVVGSLSALAAPVAVDHRISFPDLEQQYVHVVSRFPVSGGLVDIRMANWIPGSYKIRDFAANLDRIRFLDADRAPLPYQKTTKNTWRVDTAGSEVVIAEYDVYAGELSVRQSWVSADFALINPATVVLYTDRLRTSPQDIRVEVPAGMGRLYTSLAGRSEGEGWRAADFDELVDSPLVISDQSPLSFRDQGHDYHLLNVGDPRFWDAALALEGLQAVVETINDLWSVVPLDRDFWFFNFLVEGRGGLEHDHNTVMMTSRWNTRKREDFIGWLSLASHEYFHAWNVRRMRPERLAAYDYEQEQYSASLWIAEGLTSYYDNLILSRGALVSPEEYLKLLAKDLHRLELTPGRKLISLEQASNDAWIRQYGESPNRINSNISYYTKGAVVGFVLDARIRQSSRDRHSLDDVMRSMFERWAESPYPEGALRDAVAQLAGEETRAWLEPLLSGTQDPDLDEVLAYYGLVLDRHPDRTAAEQSGTHPPAGLGVNWDKQADGLVIAATVAGTAAARAGLVPGDELLAIDGQRVRSDTLNDRLQRLRPGETVELLLSRHERLFEARVELDLARPDRYEIKLMQDVARKQRKRLESWLGQAIRPVKQN